MLRELTLEQFKAFAGAEKVPIRPITLIYGQNSSGKSSIIQSLLLLKQTILEAENPNIPLLPRGKIVELGGYREFISRHDVRQNLAFKLRLRNSRWYERGAVPVNQKHQVETDTGDAGLRVTFNYDEALDAAKLSSVDLFLGPGEAPAATFGPDAPAEDRTHGFYLGFNPSARAGAGLLRVEKANYDHPFWKDMWSFRSLKYRERSDELAKNLGKERRRLREAETAGLPSEKLKARIEKIEKEIQKTKNYSFATAVKDFDKAHRNFALACSNFLPSDLRVTRFEPSDLGSDIGMGPFGYEPVPFSTGPLAVISVAAEIRTFLEDVIYLGPLREFPGRHHIFSGNIADDVGKRGTMVPDVLFKNPSVLSKVNEHFESFDIGYKLEVASVDDKRPELHDVFALRLVDSITGVNVSIVDVGFGISQVLPIIVQSMLSTKKTVLIEQPEIHLHPRLQSRLADLLAEAIGPPFQNEFIVETHSEHLMLRLQKIVDSGRLKAEQISVVYVDRTPDGSRCIPLRLDSRGNFIDRWPGGFFEESYNEIFT